MNDACKSFSEQWVFYVAGELDKPETEALQSHLKQCRSCQLEHGKWQALFGSLRECIPAAPSDEQWNRLAQASYQHWRGSTTSIIGRLVKSVMQRQVAFYAIPALAAVLIISVGIAVWFNRPASEHTSTAFWDRYTMPADSIYHLPPPLQRNANLGFSSFSHVNYFTAGQQFANAYLACRYAFQTQCRAELTTMAGMIGQLPDKPTQDIQSEPLNQADIVNRLRILGDQLQSQIQSSPPADILYRMGVWVNQMQFATDNSVNAIVGEKTTATTFALEARQYNLAKGVTGALNDIIAVLQKTQLQEHDYKALTSQFARIREILN